MMFLARAVQVRFETGGVVTREALIFISTVTGFPLPGFIMSIITQKAFFIRFIEPKELFNRTGLQKGFI
jgi:hypothetical protein